MVKCAALVLATVAAALASQAAAARETPSACDGIIPPPLVLAGVRALVPEDLARLRDIGPTDSEGHAAPFFTISRDGRRAAFQLRRADPASNSHCLAMVVLDLVPGAQPRIVDRGGALILLAVDIRGRADHPTGIARVITPRWSPDGRWIAFLKREDGSDQVWRAEADGSGSRPLTRAATDVADFRIGQDGTTIVYATRPALQHAQAAIEREGLTGFHYDDRFSPVSGDRPFPAGPIPRAVQVLDLATGHVRAATDAENDSLSTSEELIAAAGTPAHGRSTQLWISATTLTGGAQAGALHARPPGLPQSVCPHLACEGATEPWWTPDRRGVRFFRREGWARGETAIYEWRPGSDTVRRLYLTEDVLADCVPQGEELICLREGSLQPRRLERLELATGARRLLFDPNPEIAGLALGRVERLRWRNAFGLETIGDLVLPVGYSPGTRYPLVVVQYQTRGFLRGGTGDEYPIQAFANRGYAVLSFQRPIAIALARGATNFVDGNRLNLEGFGDRRSVMSSLEGGVRLAIDRGVADPGRIGITGFSDGASTAAWAILHSSLFSAAALGSCCFDTTLAIRAGPGAAREWRQTGYPGALERNHPFWRDISLSVNAHRVRLPILLQLSDDEYLTALETYAGLGEAGTPIDMFVFPGEHHAKWQPAHRLAIYRRALDWFDYWLRGIRAPGREAEIAHWDALRGSTAPRRP